ncbi:hypothetical protein GIB67_036660 [Kingdonia uniflora]|uniref:Gem-associated protein 2 n=1 Tax=Kingdonia uniflora TaxID=39325 RepID=A0A7J7LWA2_9MAGN|nr:hypothetical protein GIB67_036660 [Kingdonia uniflora]
MEFYTRCPDMDRSTMPKHRWETLQMPKVKVVKLDSNKLLKEQTDYMPKVADIANCPQHLLPSKQWEDNFLSDFSELRAALSRFESSNVQNSSSLSMDKEESSQCSNEPTVSLVLGMDSVSRTSMLKNRIRSLQYATTLSKDECSWVFALCVAVDTPFDADTSSYLRCLLRKCASLRSEKLEVDDEVVMLNILATISGRYFGQLEV